MHIKVETMESDVQAGDEAEKMENATEPRLSASETELISLKGQYHQLAADFDNFRKRTAQESNRKAAAQKEKLIHELLPVVDNMERALAVGPNTTLAQIYEGVDMTLKQVRQLLLQNEIAGEDSLGKPFDPLHHQAIGTRNDPSKPNDTVLEIAQRGYTRGKEMFRPAMVIVNDYAL